MHHLYATGLMKRVLGNLKDLFIFFFFLKKQKRLIYLAFGGLQGFACNHKDLADAIHTIDVGHCLGNALVVTKIDSYEIHLAVLSTENYGMENWDLL